jgi:predicted alpha/beta-fold hydrolase
VILAPDRARAVASAAPEFPPFEPHPLLRNAHLATVSTRIPRRDLARADAQCELRTFAVGAGSRVAALCRFQPDRRRAPAVLVVHGLMGSARSQYALGLADKAFAAGFSVARVSLRGCGGTVDLAPEILHAGQGGDLLAVMRALADEDGIERLYVAGVSLGAGMALSMLGELGLAAPAWLRGAALVSPALDLEASAAALDRSAFLRPYRNFFLRAMKDQLAATARAHPGRYDLGGLEHLETLRGFDDRYTAVAAGYRDAAAYYRGASALSRLATVARPVLLVQAKDDPLIPFAPFESPAIAGHRWIRLLATERGGHVGFVGRRPGRTATWRDRGLFWAENRAVQFLAWLDRLADPAP